MEPKKSASSKKAKSASREKIDNMLALAHLVKEIIKSGQPKHKGIKSPSDHPCIKSVDRIIKGLEGANCKIEFYLKPYRETIYAEHRSAFLKSQTPLWLTEFTIKAYLGDPKLDAYVAISMAMNTAVKLRKAIEERKYSNPNDKEEALGHFHCLYQSLLYYRLLVVIIDSLGPDHKDVSKLNSIVEKFKDQSGMGSDESSSESSEDGRPSLGKTLSKHAGEKHSTKEIEKTVSQIMGSKDAIVKVKDVVGRLGSEGNPLENKELLAETVAAVGPMFSDMFKNMAANANKDEETSSEEESESD